MSTKEKVKRYVSLLLVCFFLAVSIQVLADEPEYLGFARVLKDKTNLRKKPGGELIIKLNRDAAVYVVDKETDAAGMTWYRVHYNHNGINRAYSLDGFVRGDLLELSSSIFTDIVAISAEGCTLLCLRKDGRVIAAGGDYFHELDVLDWTGATEIASGNLISAAICPSGVVTTSLDPRFFSAVPDWTGVVRLVGGYSGAAGSRSDGTVALCLLTDWPDEEGMLRQMEAELRGATDLAVGSGFVVGLWEDGRAAVAGGIPDSMREAVSTWQDVVQIAAGVYHAVGLKTDGTVVVVLRPEALYESQCGVEEWAGIVAIDAGMYNTVGVRRDGTVVITDNDMGVQIDVSSMRNIAQVAAGEAFVAGLTRDGRVIFRGDYLFPGVYQGEGRIVVSH